MLFKYTYCKNLVTNMKSSTICSICYKNSSLITDRESGEIICSNCGMVFSEKAQEISRPEWRTFNTEGVNDRSRTGTPTSLARHDMGLSTIIGRTDKDASGYKIDAQMRSTMERLRTWDFRTQTHTPTDRNLRQAFSELDILKDKLALPDAVIEKTAYIYRKVQQIGLIQGRSIPAVIAAIVYLVCREMEIPRTLNDISTASNIKRKTLSRTYRLLILELDIKVPMVDPMKCIVTVANKANLSESTKRQAMSIMNDIRKNETLYTGKDPMGLAAIVLYLSSLKAGEYITQYNISKAAGITGVTLRNRFKALKTQLHLKN
jgi:transcription initiation factor TFIIB